MSELVDYADKPAYSKAHIVFTRKDVNDAKVRLDAIKTAILPTL